VEISAATHSHHQDHLKLGFQFLSGKLAIRFSLLLPILFTALILVSRAHAQQQVDTDIHTDTNDLPQITITTTMGDFSIELYPQHAPSTVANFLQYVDQDFYKRTLFHRIAKGFVIQAGGFDVNHQKRHTASAIKNESLTSISNTRSTLAMARTGHPDSATSQFFINLKDNLILNSHDTTPGYTVFGRVITGMDLIDKMSEIETTNLGGPFTQFPLEPIIILNIQRASTPRDPA